MVRKMLIMLSMAVLLTAAGNQFLIHSVHAESNSNTHHSNELPPSSQSSPQKNPVTVEAELPNQHGNNPSIDEQMSRVYEAIQANNTEILKIENYSKLTKAEIIKLEKEMSLLKESMEKRKTVLKERALSYQQTDKHISYLDVLLGSTSLSDFVERVGAVSAIAEADQTLLEQQDLEQQQFDTKKDNLEKKFSELSAMKTNLESLKSYLVKQQNEYSLLKKKVEEEEKKKEMETAKTYIDVSPVYQKDYINTVINAGKKYIGNSVYVFGGGRNAYDVAHGRFDCSGFVRWAFSQAGIKLGSNTTAIKKDGQQIAVSQMQPGDLVFFDTYKKDGHVGIYLGNGKFIGSQSSTGVAIADMTTGYWKSKFKGRVVRI